MIGAGTLPKGVATLEAARRMMFNDYVDAAVAAFFMISVIVILVASAHEWFCCISGRKAPVSTEVEYTHTRDLVIQTAGGAEWKLPPGFRWPVRRGVRRLENLADGVFSIAMTLLVLDLRVPRLRPTVSDGELRASLVTLIPNLLSFILSFVLLGVFWIGHHIQFSFIRRSDRTHQWLNMLFFFLMVLVPFSAAMLGRFGYHRLAVIWYGGNVAAAAFALQLHWWYRNAQSPSGGPSRARLDCAATFGAALPLDNHVSGGDGNCPLQHDDQPHHLHHRTHPVHRSGLGGLPLVFLRGTVNQGPRVTTCADCCPFFSHWRPSSGTAPIKLRLLDQEHHARAGALWAGAELGSMER